MLHTELLAGLTTASHNFPNWIEFKIKIKHRIFKSSAVSETQEKCKLQTHTPNHLSNAFPFAICSLHDMVCLAPIIEQGKQI